MPILADVLPVLAQEGYFPEVYQVLKVDKDSAENAHVWSPLVCKPMRQGQHTLLMRAAWLGKLDRVKTFVERFASNVNQTNMWGETALYHAAAHNHLRIVEYLCKKGADPNIRTIEGHTPLGKAELTGNAELVSTLRAYGAHTR